MEDLIPHGAPNLDSIIFWALQFPRVVWILQRTISYQRVNRAHELRGKTLVPMLPYKVHRRVVVEYHALALITRWPPRLEHLLGHSLRGVSSLELARGYSLFYQRVDQVPISSRRIGDLL